MTWLRKLVALPPADRRLLLEAAVLLPLVRLGLRTLPFGRLWRVTNRLARTPSAGRALPAERIAWAVSAAGRRMPGGRHCLAQAVTAYILLGRSGHTARVRLGLSRDGPRGFEAHAWVERESTVLLGGPDVSRFAPMPPLVGEHP